MSSRRTRKGRELSMPESETYGTLGRKWDATCKAVFGEEVGNLREYGAWLSTSVRPLFSRKSSLSGKEVSFVLPDYSEKARILSLDEVDFNRKYPPLAINDIKDIDSVIRAVSERVCYAGNMQLGNTKYCEESADVVESFYVLHSAQVSFSKYVAYGYNMEYAESVFGTTHHGHCNHSIMISDSDRLARCFEAHTCEESAGLYYSHRLFNCQDCMFSFNMKNARHAIGNLILPPEKYAPLKEKLLGELVLLLKKRKSLPSLMDIVGNSAPSPEGLSGIGKGLGQDNIKENRPDGVEECFEKTTKLLFGRRLSGLEGYGNYLARHSRKSVKGKSAMSGTGIWIADYARYGAYPKNRLLLEHEADLAGNRLRIDESDLDDFCLENIKRWVGKVGFFYPGLDHGELSNIVDCQVSVNSTNCFHSILNMYSKNCAYNFYELESEAVFGCNSVRKSNFVIMCFFSAKLTRCFEVDSSHNCSDCYFCHNCENIHDSMFCFNVKNKRYAIGNVEFPRERYMRAKKLLLEKIGDELERTKGLKMGVFSILEK